MRLGNRLELRVVAQPERWGTPALELRLEGLELAEPAGVGEACLVPRDRLERDDVEALRDACEDFLAGRPLRA